MSDRFAHVAMALCGLAARQLGWRPAEFWQATPGELLTVIAPPSDTTLPAQTTAPLDRATLQRLMEQDHG